MNILVATLVAGLIFSAALFIFKHILSRKKEGGSAAGKIKELDKQCAELASKVEQALRTAKEMIPLHEYTERDSKIGTLRQQLADEREKLEKLDRQVEKMQTAVEAEESAHNALKKGKEEAVALAVEVRENRDRLAHEANKLEQQLQTSLAELSALNSEVDLSRDQQIALDRIAGALENSRQQLRTLADIYAQASTRFTNLEAQFSELEKEFTKLVEKELSGSM